MSFTGDEPRPLRVAIINLMPRAEVYEPSLLRALAAPGIPLDPVLVRLSSHVYRSSDQEHLAARYVSFESARAAGKLDGVVLSGAPVEALPLAEVRYWDELSAILREARREVKSTLGLCWGAIALAELLDVGKEVLPEKVFGVYPHEVLAPSHPLLAGQDPRALCPQSRHAALVEAEVSAAADDGRLVPLARVDGGGTSIFATPDGRFVGHLGHPEYGADRLAFEWRRDRDAGRKDVPPPRNCDPETGAPHASWEGASRAFFGAWLRSLRA